MKGGGIKEFVWRNGDMNPQVLTLTERKHFFGLFTLVWFSFGESIKYHLLPAAIQISHLISKFFKKGRMPGTAQNLTQAASVLGAVEIRTS